MAAVWSINRIILSPIRGRISGAYHFWLGFCIPAQHEPQREKNKERIAGPPTSKDARNYHALLVPNFEKEILYQLDEETRSNTLLISI